MKYRINVLPPKSKRMIGNGKLIVTLHCGWEGDRKEEHKLEKTGDFEFEVPDDFEWIHTTSVMDGNSFSLLVKYENSTGSRTESYSPVPEKV